MSKIVSSLLRVLLSATVVRQSSSVPTTAPAFFHAVVCWGGSIKKRDQVKLDRLVRKVEAVVGTELDCLTTVAEGRTLSRLLTILDNVHHPLHSQQTEEHIQWQTPVTVMLIVQAEEVLCPQGHTAL